jgi:hypothetical protein
MHIIYTCLQGNTHAQLTDAESGSNPDDVSIGAREQGRHVIKVKVSSIS